MFPIGLERQNELTFVRFFERFAKKFESRVLSAIKRDLPDSVRTDDSGDLLRFLSSLAGEVDEIPEEELSRILAKNYQMIDSWAQGIVSKELSTIASLSDIEAISIASIPEMNKSLIEDAVRQGLEAYKKLTEGFKDLVYQVTLEGIRDGLRASEIAKKIRNVTGMKIKNAAFYGRDLASDVFGQVSLRRQTAAGFQYYEWRTMNDERVRDYHTDNQKEIFSWAKGADNLKKPGARHPGEDYNCRCYAKPVRDTEKARFQKRHLRQIDKIKEELNDPIHRDKPGKIWPEGITMREVENQIFDLRYEVATVFKHGTEYISKKGTRSVINWSGLGRRQLKGLVVTHNHPTGTAHSIEDLEFAIFHGLKEIRVVTPQKIVYSVRIVGEIDTEDLKKEFDTQLSMAKKASVSSILLSENILRGIALKREYRKKIFFFKDEL